MTPSARTQAAIELLDAIIGAAKEGGAAADTLIARYFATRRYAGSKDRRAVRELVYAAIRIAGDIPPDGRAAMLALADADPTLAATFDSSAHGPAPIAPDEPRAASGAAPAWLAEQLAAAGIDATTLLGRASLDVRVNRLKTTREEMLRELPDARPCDYAPDGLRLPAGTNVEVLQSFKDGRIEVQDEGSQLVGLAHVPAPDQRIVDLCAGAGGKSLALAATMQNRGTILACDVDRARLSRLAPRAERAGATLIQSRLLDPNRETAALTDWIETADAVLVDAPCSGTGTWRRNPEARWRLTPARLERLAATQAHVLDVAASLVRPGGVLVYVVCSLLDREGVDQVDAFLSRHAGWTMDRPDLPCGEPRGAGVRLTPALCGTDGFFVARARRA